MELNYVLIAMTILFASLIAFFNTYFKRTRRFKYRWITKNHFINLKWVINIIICTGFLIYFISLRYVYNVNDFIHLKGGVYNIPSNDVDLYFRSATISKTFLLDWCPWMSILICLVGIIDFKQEVLPLFGFAAFVFGIITIVGGLLFQEIIERETFSMYLFTGIAPNRIYFAMHFFMVIYGMYTFTNLRTVKSLSLLFFHLILIGYIIYVNALGHALKVVNNLSGFASGDYYTGIYQQYKTIGDFLGQNPLINGYIISLFVYIILLLGIYIRFKIAKLISKKFDIHYY
ncbi:DUF5378 family protein, partial [Ureaplasma canigenitalium]|uniref:DUF5378 family protein n=1 Tax=Ureaplasma canigenitalium TaxID=42092 RepID=UPI0004E0F383